MTDPTSVLVHGAFADASSYAPVTTRLQKRGFKVIAPGVPNRSLLGDAAYVASVVRDVDGPVVLVGHSYGGAVITRPGLRRT
jgi:pimeloyl-ACP methyl ester carboxylesterase